MTINVSDVCAAVEHWAPPGWCYEWDRSGLNLGAPDDAVRGVLVCLSVTPAAFAAALKARANLIVSHHPLVWDALRTLRTDDPHTRLCLDLAAAGIACYSAHTNFDVAPGGVNHLLAHALRLTKIRPLLPASQARQVKLTTFVPETHLHAVRFAVCDAGAGIIGDYTHCSFSAPGVGTFLPGEKTKPFAGKRGTVNEEPERRFEVVAPKAKLDGILRALFATHPYEEVAYDLVTLENSDPAVGLGARGELEKAMPLASFARRVCEALDLQHIRWVGKPKQRVQRVAVLGGAGGGQVGALPRDLDVYVTGDVKYHDAESAQERGLGVIDAGHHGTEKGIVPALAGYLRERLKGLPIAAYIEPEPFQVYRRND